MKNTVAEGAKWVSNVNLKPIKHAGIFDPPRRKQFFLNKHPQFLPIRNPQNKQRSSWMGKFLHWKIQQISVGKCRIPVA